MNRKELNLLSTEKLIELADNISLILDERESEEFHQLVEEVMDKLKEIKRKFPTACIIITHDSFDDRTNVLDKLDELRIFK